MALYQCDFGPVNLKTIRYGREWSTEKSSVKGRERHYSKLVNTQAACSNHFAFGRSTGSSPHPTLYLRRYDMPSGPPKAKRRRLDRTHSSLEWSSSPSASQSTTKVMPKEQLDARASSSSVGNSADEHQSLIATAAVAEPLSPIEKQCKPSPASPSSLSQPNSSVADDLHLSLTSSSLSIFATSRLCWEAVSSNDSIMKLYTGCPTAKVFMFIVNRIRPEHGKVSYYRGK